MGSTQIERAVEIVVVLDASGSMATKRDDVIGGFNTFIEDQKELPGEARLTLVSFSDTHHTVLDAAPIRDVEPLTEESYSPGGSTALLDAVGEAINATRARIERRNDPVDVIVAIITDGRENCSREFTREQIRLLVEQMGTQPEPGWKFVFLGQGIDAFREAGGIGIDSSQGAQYASACLLSGGEGLTRGSRALSHAVSSYRSDGRIDSDGMMSMLTSDKDGSGRGSR